MDVLVYDSMMYDWGDSLAEIIPKIEWMVGDKFQLSDSLVLKSQVFLMISETLVLSDGSRNDRSQLVEVSVGDTLNYWDNIVNLGYRDSLIISVSDAFIVPSKSINSWTDGVDLYGSTSFIDYIRRYLNDKVTVGG